MIEGWTGPLHMTHLAHFFVGHAVEEGAQLAHFVPDLLVILVMHGIAHFRGQQADDLPVAPDIAAGLNGFAETLKAAIGTGEHTGVFSP